MVQLIVRKVDPVLKQRLRMQAARNGRSMEEEHREILRRALAGPDFGAENFVDVAKELFGAEQGVDISDLRDRPSSEPIRPVASRPLDRNQAPMPDSEPE